jgi:hypothetical protein
MSLGGSRLVQSLAWGVGSRYKFPDGDVPRVHRGSTSGIAVQIWTSDGVILTALQEVTHDAQPDPSHHSLPHLNFGLRLRV